MADPFAEIPVKPVGALLDDAVLRFAASPAMYFLGRSWTYAELGDLVERASCGLQELGVRKGDRVGLCLPNSPYFVICYFAVLKAGATVVNFNPLYVERELLHQVKDSGTTIMVTLNLPTLLPKVADLLGRACLERVVVCPISDILPQIDHPEVSALRQAEITDISQDNRLISFPRLIASAHELTPVEITPETDIAVIQYTGGTTGVPKGATLTHANLTANVEQVYQWVNGSELEGGRVLCALPLFHVFAMTVAMNLGVTLGAEMLLMPRFDVNDALQLITAKRPTIFPGVPTMFTALNGVAKSTPCDLSSVRLCISGGAPLPLEVRREFERLSGCRLIEGYGLSETSPVLTVSPVAEGATEGSAGQAIPGTVIEVRSTDDPTVVLGIGEKGEICVRGPQVMAGYWQRPADTAAIMIDGALRTGDVGYVDEKGNLFLVDRIKDLIICSGYNVYPRVIEEALHRHPAVAEAMVIGVPDPYRGQSPKAFVRLRDGTSASAEEIRAFLGDYLSPVEMPKAIEFRNVLPKTAVGKLSKKDLVAQESGQGAL